MTGVVLSRLMSCDVHEPESIEETAMNAPRLTFLRAL